MTQKKPKISIIIPAYNAEKTLTETIQSALNQTFKNFEIIVVNDGSTDKTLDVIKQIKDERIKVFSQKNKGQSSARNLGIKKSRGDYIAFLDADDLWTKDKLELQLKALKKEKTEVVYSFIGNIDKNGKFLPGGKFVKIKGNVYNELIINNFIRCGSNIMVKKENIEKIGGFDESLQGVEDWDLAITLARDYQFVCVPKIQILYRYLPESWSNSQIISMERNLRKLYNKHIKIDSSLKKIKGEFFAEYYYYLTGSLIRNTKIKKRTRLIILFFIKSLVYNPLSIFKKQTLHRFAGMIRGIILPYKKYQK